MVYSVRFTEEAKLDIKQAMVYYNNQQKGLGSLFRNVVKAHSATLSKSPYFSIRYSVVHCLPIKGFPFMFHYIIDEAGKRVIVLGVVHTSLDPRKSYFYQ